MSSQDMTARLGLSSLGKKVFEKALAQFKPCSWMVRLQTERIVENIRFIDEVANFFLISQSLNLPASELE